MAFPSGGSEAGTTGEWPKATRDGKATVRWAIARGATVVGDAAGDVVGIIATTIGTAGGATNEHGGDDTGDTRGDFFEAVAVWSKRTNPGIDDGAQDDNDARGDARGDNDTRGDARGD